MKKRIQIKTGDKKRITFMIDNRFQSPALSTRHFKMLIKYFSKIFWINKIISNIV